MPKRSFPFEESSRLQLKTHIYEYHIAIEKEKIYARTLELMHKGSLQFQKDQVDQSSNVPTEQTFKCRSCAQSKSEVPMVCFFCERQSCAGCSRQCENCAGNFCTLCSLTNYDQRLERCFCLGCSEHWIKRAVEGCWNLLKILFMTFFFQCWEKLFDWKRFSDTKGAFHLTELTNQTRYLEGLTLQCNQTNTLRGWYVYSLGRTWGIIMQGFLKNCCLFFAIWWVWLAISDKRKAP